MSRVLIRAGYDFARSFTFKLEGDVEDLSTATIEACLKNEGKTAELITDTAQANTAPASWATGIVVLRFPAASTTSLTPGNAWIEVAVVLSGARLAYEDIPVVIEAGYAL